MKKTFIAVALIATQALQAQILYVNNADDTYQAIDTKETKEVTFDEEQHSISQTVFISHETAGVFLFFRFHDSVFSEKNGSGKILKKADLYFTSSRYGRLCYFLPPG